jgi:Holliday junction resolvase RusA-like endonuclease
VIAKQRPLKADKLIDHDGDYGFPEGKEYFKYEVKKSDVDNVLKAKQEALEVAHEKKAQ